MKMKRSLCLLLALTMVLSTMPYSAFATETKANGELVTYEAEWTNPVYDNAVVAPPADESTIDNRGVSYYTTVEEAGAYLRQQMVNRATTVEFKFTSENFSQETFDVIYNEAIKHTGVPTEGDYLKFVCGGWSGTASGMSNEPYITVKYTINYYNSAEAEETLDILLANFVPSLNLEGKSDYEIICGIYDYITDTVEYDYEHLGNEDYKLQYTAYAAFVNKTSVCQGYATLFYRLALTYGIDARIISGQSYDQNHAWNIVKLDGMYYYLDATWDSTWDDDTSNHDYFLRGSKYFGEHQADAEYTDAAFVANHTMSTDDYEVNEPAETPGEEDDVIEEEGEGAVENPEEEGDNDDADKFQPDEEEDQPVAKPEKLPAGAVKDGNFAATIKNGKATIVRYLGTETKNVVVPSKFKKYPVTRVAYGTFRNHEEITSIKFSAGITSLDGGCVDRCDNLTDIYLADTTSIDKRWSHSDNCFLNVPKLKNVHVSDKNKYLTEYDGVIYSKDKKTLLYYPEGRTKKSLSVRKGTTRIAEGAFENTSIKKVSIPSSVKEIGYFAFNNSDLETVTIANGCESIGQWAFSNTKLKTIHIPASVEGVIMPAFNNNSLKSIEVDEKNKDFYSKDGVLYSKTKVLVCYPSQKTDTTYTMPRDIAGMSQYAFANAEHLKTVNLSSKIKMIPDSAFENCKGLESMVLPESVTTICEYAFMNCRSLGSVTMPASVKKIEEDAFANIGWVVIFGKKGTYAEKYGKKRGMFYPTGTNIIKENFDDGMTWTLNVKEKRVVVEGNGVCSHMSLTPVNNMVEEIVFSDGITKVCDSSFPFMGNLKRVVFAKTVTEIDDVYFEENNEVETMYFENADCKISGLHLEEGHKCTFYSTPGSKVAAYAQKHNQPSAVHNGHVYSDWTINGATYSASGSKYKSCVCGDRITETISKVSTAKLSTSEYVYNGKSKSPGLIIKDSKGKTLKKGTDYTLTTPSGRKNVGKYTYTICFKGNYSGTKTLTLTIRPKASSVKKLTASKKAVTVKWSKVSSQITGYQIQYASNSKFTKGKGSVKVTKGTSKKISKLKSKKTYYVRVRTYKTVKINGKSTTVYSSWSNAKKVKVK